MPDIQKTLDDYTQYHAEKYAEYLFDEMNSQMAKQISNGILFDFSFIPTVIKGYKYSSYKDWKASDCCGGSCGCEPKKRTIDELRQVKTYGYTQPSPTKQSINHSRGECSVCGTTAERIYQNHDEEMECEQGICDHESCNNINDKQAIIHERNPDNNKIYKRKQGDYDNKDEVKDAVNAFINEDSLLDDYYNSIKPKNPLIQEYLSKKGGEFPKWWAGLPEDSKLIITREFFDE